jgi:hypothetical protein
MPNKYEREIEEILRNLERSEPKAGFGRRGSGRPRRKPGARRSMPAIRLSLSEWCLIIAGVAALSAGGWAYAQHEDGGNIITGIIALIGAVCVALVAISPFINRRRYSPSAGHYNNVTPIRSNPFSRLGTRWHLMLLKLRYRRQKERDQD